MRKTLFSLVMVVFTTLGVQAQAADDTSSVDKIIGALYDVISGKAGPRNWNRFRSLYYEGATMGIVYTMKQGEKVYTRFSPEEYIMNNEPYFLEQDFYERELFRKVQIYNQVAVVFSTYEYESGTTKQRGINAITLVFANDRWWISSLIWEPETEGNPVPGEYLR